ncbi:Gfo/Idh/MocA family protein [Uliginosibacterium sp. sgz301328]|uniref:Gfo/Idh/MocA family protein n=1 Tax=Uliginosibacterium sp. sgz301328 TaxID=3243764 RepID=UPI00359D9183
MRYVIVGTGNISNTYVAAFKNLPGCELVGCVSRSGRTPKDAPHLECRASLAEIQAPFDAVIITSPNGLHHISAIEAAALGKHVLTEKPLDITMEAMDKMVAACEAAGVQLAVAFQRRTNPDNVAVKKLLEAGALGRIYAADLSCRFWRDQAYYDSGDYRGGWAIDGGGPFIQQASHNIDNYIWFFGMPDQVTSQLGTFAHDIETEDHGAALLRHDSGMIGTIVASTCARPGYPARLEVICEKGTFTMQDDRIHTWNIDGVPNPASAVTPRPDDGARSAAVADTSRHEAVIRDFEQAIASNTRPLADAADGRRATELILRIYGKL